MAITASATDRPVRSLACPFFGLVLIGVGIAWPDHLAVFAMAISDL